MASNLYEKLRKSYRPWKTKDEIPKFALIRHRGKNDNRFPMALTTDCVGESNTREIQNYFKRVFGIKIAATFGVYPSEKPDFEFWHMVHSIDGGKTWHPCGVII